MNRTWTQHRKREGSALLLVLWAIGLLSFAILGLVVLISHDQDETNAHSRDFRARQLAESGLAVALNPFVQPGDPVLKQELAPMESFEARVSSEGARFQINQILASDNRLLLHKLFTRWGLTDTEADTVYDCLADWVDADNTKRTNGAENEEYVQMGKPDFPPNRPFQSVDEMALVKNMDILEKKKPDWRNYFTVWSDGRIDVNQAPAEVLAVALSLTDTQAQSIVDQRNGPDHLPNTDDDVLFTNVSQLQLLLGMSLPVFQQVASTLVVNDSVLRVISTGHVGRYQRTLEVVVRRNTNPPVFLQWQEY